jgi:hypothetical protein
VIAITAGERGPRDNAAVAEEWSGPAQTTGNTNMNATRNTGMNDIRALSAAELDAVSGGAESMGFDFTVAGMRIQGYGGSDGFYGVQVDYGNKFVSRDGFIPK